MRKKVFLGMTVFLMLAFGNSAGALEVEETMPLTVVESEQINMYIQSFTETKDEYIVNVLTVNNSSETVEVFYNNQILDGCMVRMYYSTSREVPAGKKLINEFSIHKDELQQYGIEEIHEYSFNMTYEFESGSEAEIPVTLHFQTDTPLVDKNSIQTIMPLFSYNGVDVSVYDIIDKDDEYEIQLLAVNNSGIEISCYYENVSVDDFIINMKYNDISVLPGSVNILNYYVYDEELEKIGTDSLDVLEYDLLIKDEKFDTLYSETISIPVAEILANPEEFMVDETETETEPEAETEILETEKELIETEETNENVIDKANANLPLTGSDFVIEVENDIDGIAQYDNDMSVMTNSLHREGGYVYYDGYQGDPDENSGDVTTYRGIRIGENTREELLAAYGVGVSLDFNKKTDSIYNALLDNNDLERANLLSLTGSEVIFYNYKDIYQLIFYIDERDIVRSFAFCNVIVYEADKETVQYVQNALNEKDYDCGTPDGILGQNTKDAILEFQKDNGLYESGAVDDQVLKILDTGKAEDCSLVKEDTSLPKDIVVDKAEWDKWKSTGKCSLFPFMEASGLVNFSWGNPNRDGDDVTVECYDEKGNVITDFSMYYGVSNQKIIYAGLNTNNSDSFWSENFRNSCVKLMMAYNSHFENGDPVLNLTRERAEEIVDYAMNNAKYCLADGMRIRVIELDDYYSFHIEY